MKHEKLYEYIDLELLHVQDEYRKLQVDLFGSIKIRISKPLLAIYIYE